MTGKKRQDSECVEGFIPQSKYRKKTLQLHNSIEGDVLIENESLQNNSPGERFRESKLKSS